MKKILLVMFVALTGLCASAQQGKMAIGADLGVVPVLEGDGSPTNLEIGAKFQYGITDNVRFEADIDYAFKAKNIDFFDLTANVHYLVPVSGGVSIYPLVGIGYGHAAISASKHVEGIKFTASEGYNRFLFNIGAGADFKLSDNLVLNFELKYQYFKDFSRLPIKVGINYTF